MELLRWPESAGLKERNTHEKNSKPTEVENHHKKLRPKWQISLTAAIRPSGVKQHMAIRNDARPHRVARNVPDVKITTSDFWKSSCSTNWGRHLFLQL